MSLITCTCPFFQHNQQKQPDNVTFRHLRVDDQVESRVSTINWLGTEISRQVDPEWKCSQTRILLPCFDQADIGQQVGVRLPPQVVGALAEDAPDARAHHQVLGAAQPQERRDRRAAGVRLQMQR